MIGRRAAQVKRIEPPKSKILKHKGGKVTAPIDSIKIQRNFNVRQYTEPDEDLCKSIEEHGVLNPIHVRWKDNKEETLLLVDGERRYRAAKAAKWNEVPVVCRGHIDDREALIISLTTNENQLSLTNAERAVGFKRLAKAGLSETEIAGVMGCSKRMVTETLRLVEKATSPIRKAAMNNGDGKIPVRAASRAATLPVSEQKKLAPKLIGKTTEEALEEVRKIEKKLGVVPKGTRAPKKKKRAVQTKSSNLQNRLNKVERAIKAALKKTPSSRNLKAQMVVVEILKGKQSVSVIGGDD